MRLEGAIERAALESGNSTKLNRRSSWNSLLMDRFRSTANSLCSQPRLRQVPGAALLVFGQRSAGHQYRCPGPRFLSAPLRSISAKRPYCPRVSLPPAQAAGLCRSRGTEKAALGRNAPGPAERQRSYTPTPVVDAAIWYEIARRPEENARKSLWLKRVQISSLLSYACSDCPVVTD